MFHDVKMSQDLTSPLVYNRVHRTCPALVHAPGKLEESPWWNALKEEVFSTRDTYSECESLAIVTWNSGAPNQFTTARGHSLGWFERSLAHFGVQYTVLGSGIGDRWINRMKMDLTIEFLANSDRELVLGADSSDVLLVADPRRIVEAYRQQEAEVLFNAEKKSWPPELKEMRRFERRVTRGPFRFFNSGVWIGRREACLRAFSAAKRWAEQLKVRPNSDQICWKHAYQELYPAVQVDWRCTAFQNLNQVRREIEVRGRRLPRSSGIFCRMTRGWFG
jgi:hypothetical protein